MFFEQIRVSGEYLISLIRGTVYSITSFEKLSLKIGESLRAILLASNISLDFRESLS